MVDKTMMGDKCAELVRAAMIGALAVTLGNPTAVYAAEERIFVNGIVIPFFDFFFSDGDDACRNAKPSVSSRFNPFSFTRCLIFFITSAFFLSGHSKAI